MRQQDEPESPQASEEPLFCDRCLRQLRPGRGEHYEVHVEAFADPDPPQLDIDDQPLTVADLHGRLQDLTAEMQDLSAQEAMDQVHRRLTFCLCNACFRVWIEHPTRAGD